MYNHHSKTVRLLSWFTFLNSFRLYQAFLVLYFARATHSYALALGIVAITQAGQALFEVPTGIYSDRLGRRKCLIYGALGGLLSVVCYAGGQGYLSFIAGALFQGASQALFSGNNNALLYEALAGDGKEGLYHEKLGIVSFWMEMAFFASGILGGIVAFHSYSLLMWLSCIPQAAAVCVACALKEPAVHRPAMPVYAHLKNAASLYRASRKLRLLSIAGVIALGVGEAAWPFFPVFFSTLLPVWTVGFVISGFGLISAVGYRMSGRLIERFGVPRLLIGSEMFSKAINIMATAIPTIASPFLLAVSSIYFAPCEVAKSKLLQKEFTDAQRATLSSINAFLGNAFQALCAVLIGMLADRFGPAKSLLIAQFAGLPILWIYITMFRGRYNSRYYGYDRHCPGTDVIG